MVEFAPLTPAQPDKSVYPATSLELSPRLTRPIYEQMFGEQAPAYDPARRIKRWFFTDVLKGATNPDTEMVTYKVWDSGKGGLVEISMTKTEAATPNLPGTVVYAKYLNSETTTAVLRYVDAIGTIRDLPQNGSLFVDPALLNRAVAEASKALGVTITAEESVVTGPFKLVYGAETRRKMNVVMASGSKLDGAMLLKNRFEKGLWAPGKWSLNAAGHPVFTPDTPVDGEQDVRPEIPIPCRDLLPNERVPAIAFGGMYWSVERTDMAVPGQTASTGGGLTDAQAAQLTQIATGVAAIQRALGLGA